MKRSLLTILTLFLFCPLFAQQKADITGLLIEAYEFFYWPDNLEPALIEDISSPVFTCIERPDDFYQDFQDERIGFDLLQIKKEIFSFSFSDSVHMPLKIPLRITSDYGELRSTGYHLGIDFGLNIGDTVYSVFCGEVRIEKFDPRGYGNVVVVRNYNMSETLYGHLDKSLVRNGQKVTVGQPIGIGGNTGTSSGPHLHFEIRSSGYSFNPIVDNKFFKKYPITY